jgi:RimJ/RimL family protein N-acetyltransferase
MSNTSPSVTRRLAAPPLPGTIDPEPARLLRTYFHSITMTNPPAIECVQLAPATMDDFDFLFELKSQPDSVYWGGFAKPPEREVLKRHYESLFAAGTRHTLIVRFDGARAGVVSYAFTGDAEGGEDTVCTDYSINVSDRFSGRGVGRAALEQNVEHLRAHHPRCRTIVALIREDNPRSQRIFADCGYALTGRHEDRVLDSDRKPIRLQAWSKAIA